MIYLIEIYIPILVSRQRDRRKKKKKKTVWVPTSGEASFSKLLSFLRLASSSLEERCFFFFNPENVPRRRKEWSGGRRRRGAWARKLVGKRRETKRPWHWCWGRMANSGIVKGNFWASVSSLSQLSRIKKKKKYMKNVRKKKILYFDDIFFLFFLLIMAWKCSGKSIPFTSFDF